MAIASYVQTNFTGGEISQTAQGRLDLPVYKTSLNVCLNWIPIEAGALMRRPGTRYIAHTRGGGQGRLIPFAFEQNFPYNMAFTDGFMRFTTGNALVMTNDAQAVVAISNANPAVVQTTSAHGWSTGNQVMFNSLGTNNPLLQNRQFAITVVDTTHFSLADAITGANIDGSTLGAFVSGNVTRILEIATTYSNGSWSSVRSVQAETRSVLLNGTHPQILQVATEPTPNLFATFTLGAADFLDGPYLDPIAGSQISSSAQNGIVTLTLSFQAYDSTRAYNIGDFVTSAGIGYKSLTALNQGNTPVSSPSNWVAVNAGAPVNGGLGFVASDIGRLIRLFSEPALYNPANTYVATNVVAYPDGNGGAAYYTATGNIAANTPPGTSTSWALTPTAANWTWAQITAVSGSGLIALVSAIGTMTGGGGLAAAFDSNTSKAWASSATSFPSVATEPAWIVGNYTNGNVVQYNGFAYTANYNLVTSSGAAAWVSTTTYVAGNQVQYNGFVWSAVAGSNGVPPGSDGGSKWSIAAGITTAPPAGSVYWTLGSAMTSPTFDRYVGQNYAVAQAIQTARVYPTSDIGFFRQVGSSTMTLNLRAKATAPASASDGTLLGTTGPISNQGSAITIASSDNVTTWNYVWIEMLASFNQPLPDDGSHVFLAKMGIAQVQFYGPSTSNGAVVTAQIRGDALLNNQTIRTWRLGVYSDTTGWPTCGTYHEGRVWFGGVVANRFDGCVSNGFSGVQLNFAPTTALGAVLDSSAISYTCTGEDVNQFLWMKPDQQGILCGTQAGEWLISAPSPGPLTPTNVKAVRVTKIGCANIEPRRAEHTLIFVQRFTRKLMEYFADVFSGKFSAPNLSERAKHLTVGGVQEIAYQQELAPIAWGRRGDGTLIGATYKRDTLTTSQGPNMIGWHRHVLGSGRALESICVGPSQNGNLDTLSMVTNDISTGIRHIENMTDLLDEGFAFTDCWFLDDGIVPTSTVVQAKDNNDPFGSLLVNGLWALNGKTVTAYIAGLDCGDYTVSNGSITVPFGDGVSAGTANGLFTAALVQSFATLPAVIGFTYNSDVQSVRPVTQAETGTQAGPGFAKIGRSHRMSAFFYNAVNGSIFVGSSFAKLDPAKLRYPNDAAYPINVPWSGIWRDSTDSPLDFDGRIAIRISRPNPGFIMNIGAFDSKADA